MNSAGYGNTCTDLVVPNTSNAEVAFEQTKGATAAPVPVEVDVVKVVLKSNTSL